MKDILLIFLKGSGKIYEIFLQILMLKSNSGPEDPRQSQTFNKHVQDLVIGSVAVVSMHLGTFVVRILCRN